MRTSSEKFGLLLSRIFLGDREALSVQGAARLLGMRTAEARAVLEVLAQEGLLCRGRSPRSSAFLADTSTTRYKRCRNAFCLRRGIN